MLELIGFLDGADSSLEISMRLMEVKLEEYQPAFMLEGQRLPGD